MAIYKEQCRILKLLFDGCDEGNVYEGLGNCYGSRNANKPSNKDELVQKSIMMYQKAIEIDSQRSMFISTLASLRFRPIQKMP